MTKDKKKILRSYVHVQGIVSECCMSLDLILFNNALSVAEVIGHIVCSRPQWEPYG
jgi:hypothetical protein